ncbi:RodZ domain-containing protein [Sulfurirhabdus autotrophica]|uniref:Cytoskeleton protein RodZ n=1 Tax=Sulfurirhabdus autotrophica TaxID=1706046 RepID=A0A4R3Y6G9_9PROT|nr:RodZ domain-containing protein [Sulfurirhabdus autotrophica]TCV87400.1 cytoskeleton protein RodZ [Sulfurirhabdus autotrophica]
MSEEIKLEGEVPSNEKYSAALTIGQILLRARQTQGLHIADVARSLKLGVRQVEAMEADEHEKLPGITFVKGFIRNYARLLQLDPEPMLASLQVDIAHASAPPISSSNAGIEISSGHKKMWLWMSLAILLLVVGAPLLVYELLNSQPQQLKSGKGSVNTVVTPSALPKVTLPPAISDTQVTLPLAKPGNESVVEPAAELPKEAAPSVPAEETLAPGERTIKMAFNSDAWVEIQDKSGKSIFSQLNAAGSEQLVKGMPPFTIVVGNAANVRMTYNGKQVDLTPFIKVSVARLTLQ